MKAVIRRLHLSKQVFRRRIKQRLNFSEAVYIHITMGPIKKNIKTVFNNSCHYPLGPTANYTYCTMT